MNYFPIISLLILGVHLGNLVKLSRIGDSFSRSIQFFSNRSVNLSRIPVNESISDYFGIATCFSNSKCLALSHEYEGYLYFAGWHPLPGR